MTIWPSFHPVKDFVPKAEEHAVETSMTANADGATVQLNQPTL